MCRNSSFPSLWEHWKFVPTWRKSRTRAVYLFMWYITSYIWYIGPVLCLQKQGEMILSDNAIGCWSGSYPTIIVWAKLTGRITVVESLGILSIQNDSLVSVLQEELLLAWKGLSELIARLGGEPGGRWPLHSGYQVDNMKVFFNAVLHNYLLLIY